MVCTDHRGAITGFRPKGALNSLTPLHLQAAAKAPVLLCKSIAKHKMRLFILSHRVCIAATTAEIPTPILYLRFAWRSDIISVQESELLSGRAWCLQLYLWQALGSMLGYGRTAEFAQPVFWAFDGCCQWGIYCFLSEHHVLRWAGQYQRVCRGTRCGGPKGAAAPHRTWGYDYTPLWSSLANKTAYPCWTC